MLQSAKNKPNIRTRLRHDTDVGITTPRIKNHHEYCVKGSKGKSRQPTRTDGNVEERWKL